MKYFNFNISLLDHCHYIIHELSILSYSHLWVEKQTTIFNNRGFYINVNYFMWIDLGLIEILLLMKNMRLSLHYFNHNSSRLLLLVDKFFYRMEQFVCVCVGIAKIAF